LTAHYSERNRINRVTDLSRIRGTGRTREDTPSRATRRPASASQARMATGMFERVRSGRPWIPRRRRPLHVGSWGLL